MKTIRINPLDNVFVALEELQPGTDGDFIILDKIPGGHKFAAVDIPEGADVIKYGMPIGKATRFIKAGEHIHTHNLKTGLDGTLDYVFHGPCTATPVSAEQTTFMGYPRSNGSAGVRNNIFIVPTVGCVNKLAERLAAAINPELPEGCDPCLALTHPYGCSQLGSDHEMTRAILAGHVNHPNAAGVLVLGLGCENNTVDSFRKLLGDYDPDRVKFLVAQEAEDEFAAGMLILRGLAAAAAAQKRVPVPVSKLVVGLKCGGSDGLSGITANALVGRFSDAMISRGASAILGEVPEMFGAETLLMDRCSSKEVFDKCVEMINGFKDYFTRHGQVIYENPSPGNKAGGISTLEDKSLGCTQKGGSAPVADVLLPGEHPCVQGLNLITGPGNDMVATTLLSASGAQIVLFTTGRGTPFGGVVPTVKISSNSALAAKKKHWIDFDAGVLTQDCIDSAEVDAQFLNLVLDITSGKKAKNELANFQEIAVFKDGVTL